MDNDRFRWTIRIDSNGAPETPITYLNEWSSAATRVEEMVKKEEKNPCPHVIFNAASARSILGIGLSLSSLSVVSSKK